MSVISDLIERLRSLIFRSREERELDEELRTHMEMEAEYRRRSGRCSLGWPQGITTALTMRPAPLDPANRWGMARVLVGA